MRSSSSSTRTVEWLAVLRPSRKQGRGEGRGRPLNIESCSGRTRRRKWKREDRSGGAKSSRQIGLTRLYYPRGTRDDGGGGGGKQGGEERPDNPAPGRRRGRVGLGWGGFEFMARCLGSEGIEGGREEEKKGKGRARGQREREREESPVPIFYQYECVGENFIVAMGKTVFIFLSPPPTLNSH